MPHTDDTTKRTSTTLSNRLATIDILLKKKNSLSPDDPEQKGIEFYLKQIEKIPNTRGGDWGVGVCADERQEHIVTEPLLRRDKNGNLLLDKEGNVIPVACVFMEISYYYDAIKKNDVPNNDENTSAHNGLTINNYLRHNGYTELAKQNEAAERRRHEEAKMNYVSPLRQFIKD